MFLSTLPSRSISESLLSHYCGMLNNPTVRKFNSLLYLSRHVFIPSATFIEQGDQNVDEELKHICAFSFPAVLQIIGKNRWKEVRTVRTTYSLLKVSLPIPRGSFRCTTAWLKVEM